MKTIGEGRRGHVFRFLGFGLLLVFAAAWEFSARSGLIQSQAWPPFSDVLRALFSGLFVTGDLLFPLLTSAGRMVLGLLLGSLVGIALGLLLGASDFLYRLLNPLIDALRPVPTPALIPPLILFLGVEDALKLFLVSLGVFFPMFVNTVSGVRGVDEILLATARTLRVGRVRKVVWIILPAVLPSIFSGLRVSLGLALVITVLVEMIAGASGIGYYIVETQYSMRAAAMYAAVICLGLLGYVLNGSFYLVERKLLPWWGRGAVEK